MDDDGAMIPSEGEGSFWQRRSQWSVLVLESFDFHCVVPGTLGAKAASLQHKVSTVLHGLSLECPTLESVQMLVAGQVSMTTDMGVELGLSDASHSGFWQWFGKNARPARMIPDGGCPGSSDDSGEENANRDGGEHLFPISSPVPGLLHILDNLLGTVHSELTCWKEFEKCVRCLCQVFCKHAGIESFVEGCLKQGGFPQYIGYFKEPFKMYIEWRWSSAVQTLEWLLRVSDIIIQVWDSRKFAAGRKPKPQRATDEVNACAEPEGDSGVDVDKVEYVVRNPFFWMYCRMLWSIHHCVQKLVYWSESCACHPYKFDPDDKHARWHRKMAFQTLVGKGFESKAMLRSCPMEGKRSPELACGALDSLALADLDAMEVRLSSQCVHISVEQRTTLLVDFQIARGIIAAGLQAKTSFWGVIPWRLCGVLHHDVAEARASAAECLRQWDRRPHARKHHRVSAKFLSTGCVHRLNLERFIAGASWEDLDEDFVQEIVPLMFIPCAERLIEGRHALVSNRLSGHQKRRHPTIVSLSSGRLEEFSRRVLMRPETLKDVGEKLELVRSFPKVAEVLQIMDHPSISPLWRDVRKLSAHQWERPVCEVIYRCDAESKFASKAQQRRDHEASRHFVLGLIL